MGRVVAVAATLSAIVVSGCESSSSGFTCCIDYNGAQSYWACPNQASETACCASASVSDPPGCITQPMDPAAAGCTDTASPSDCP